MYHKNMGRKEFNEILDIAIRAVSRIKSRRAEASDELTLLGAKAVRPLVYVIECWLCSPHASDKDIDRCAERVAEVILKIGKPALPDLEDFAVGEQCNLYVNSWAQDMIFQVLELEGIERQEVCHFFEKMLLPGKKRMWVSSCDAKFTEAYMQIDGKRMKQFKKVQL